MIIATIPKHTLQSASPQTEIRKMQSLTKEQKRSAVHKVWKLVGFPLHITEKGSAGAAMRTTYSKKEAAKRALRRSKTGSLPA